MKIPKLREVAQLADAGNMDLVGLLHTPAPHPEEWVPG